MSLILSLSTSTTQSPPWHEDYEGMVLRIGPDGRMTDEQRQKFAFTPPDSSPSKQMFYEKALRHFNSCAKSNPSFYAEDPTGAYLLAKLGRWNEALKKLDKIATNVWRTPKTIEAAEFCLSQNRPDMARHFEKRLAGAIDNVDALITLSKIASATNRKADAEVLARRALYIESAKANDQTKSLKFTESVSTVALPTPNVSSSEKFWKLIDGIIDGGKYLLPLQVKELVPTPRFVTQAGGPGNNVIETAFGTSNPASTISQAITSFARGVPYAPDGVILEPNVLTCCLKKQEVIKHLEEKRLSFETTYIPRCNASENELPELTLTAALPAGKAVYTFDNKGFGRLKQVAIVFNKSGPALAHPIESDFEKTWRKHYAAAQESLVSNQYDECKASLCAAFYAWDSGSNLLRQSAARRKQYELFKQAFCELYTKWNKPEIKKFFDQVSYFQLRGEVLLVKDVPSERHDFFTLTEFRNNKWMITKKWSEPFISIKDPLRWDFRKAMKGTPLYDALNKNFEQLKISSASSSDNSCPSSPKIEQPLSAELHIEPPPGKLLDDENFE